MLVIGLTGGIGSGKSTIAALFEQLGAPIIDADIIARQLTQPDMPAYFAILQHFSAEILKESGELNRKKLRDIIFSCETERQWLEQLLHPLILSEIKRQLKNIHANYCIVVIPLLIEITPYPFLDRILVVNTSLENQHERVSRRDNIKKNEVEAIINTQISNDERLRYAHDVILNDGKLEDLLPQVEALHRAYQNLSNGE